MKTLIRQLVPLAFVAAIAVCGTASAATLTVTSADGYGPGTLRDAIFWAQDGDTIVFDSSLNGKTIDLTTNAPIIASGLPYAGSPYYSELLIDKSLTIQGLGSDQLTISAGNYTRVFDVPYGVQATISGVSIVDGNGEPEYPPPSSVAWADGYYYGGAIYSEGDLTLSDCVVADSGYFPFPPYASVNFGGGICNYGTMTIDGCTVTGNAIVQGGGGAGGGILNFGTMLIHSSSVFDNYRIYEGYLYSLDNVTNYGSLKVQKSHIQKK